MHNTELRCDGCGQLASPEHIARRLQRLEWTTRSRPVHINTLLLGAVTPENDSEFVYCPGGHWNGEAGLSLATAGLAQDGKSPEALLAEFQRGGFFVTHVLECPLPSSSTSQELDDRVADRLPSVLTRIRRSLKPKRIALISRHLQHVIPAFQSAELNCAILLDNARPFAFDGDAPADAAADLREVVASQHRSVTSL